MAYETVNSVWPEGTRDGRDLKPTPDEAIAAVKRLYRLAMKKPWSGEFKITSGRRYTWPRSGTFYVNPDYRGGGWHELVHLVSHYASYRLFPNAKGHGHQHAHLEREMITYAVKSGWLQGALKSKAATKPPVDKVTERAARVLARIKSWESKKRRAETALRKLKRQRAYYDKKSAA